MNGTVESDEIYYVNYCDVADFKQMLANGFNLTEKIVLCKYGGLFRGNKVSLLKKNLFFNSVG